MCSVLKMPILSKIIRRECKLHKGTGLITFFHRSVEPRKKIVKIVYLFLHGNTDSFTDLGVLNRQIGGPTINDLTGQLSSYCYTYNASVALFVTLVF